MALEALARALEQTGRDYFNVRREDDLHTRDRADRIADEQRQMENQKKWFEYSSAEGLKAKLAEFNAMSDAEKQKLARDLGIDPATVPAEKLGEVIFQAQLTRGAQTKSAEVNATVDANLGAAERTRGRKQALEDADNEGIRAQVYGMYQGLGEDLKKAADRAGVSLPDSSQILTPLAQQKLAEKFKNPETRARVLADAGRKTVASQLEFSNMSPVEQAVELGLIKPEDEAIAKKKAYELITQDARFPQEQAAGFQRRLQQIDQINLERKLEVNPYVKWEDQTFYKNLSPEGAKAGAKWFTPTAPASTSAAGGSGFGSLPATPAPVTPRVPAPTVDDGSSYGGAIGWLGSGGPLPALGKMSDPLISGAATVVGGQKLNQQVHSAAQGVHNFFAPITPDQAFQKSLEQNRGSTLPNLDPNGNFVDTPAASNAFFNNPARWAPPPTQRSDVAPWAAQQAQFNSGYWRP